MSDPMSDHTLSPPRVQLAVIGGGLILLHLVLTWKWASSTDQLVLNILFWLAISLLLWRQRDRRTFQSRWLASGLGTVLMGLLLLKSLSLLPSDTEFIRLFPGFAALAWGLLASGFHLKQYWREGLIVLTLLLPPGGLDRLIEWAIGSHIQVLIAQSAAFLLHFFGVNVAYRGIEILSQQGLVQVEYACTGVTLLILLGQLSMLFRLSFPVLGWHCRYLFLMAPLLAWGLATIRVAIMVLALGDRPSFEYWHGPAGGQIFSTLAILSFALLSQWLIEFPAPSELKPADPSQCSSRSRL
jgi:cyanoexosortase A